MSVTLVLNVHRPLRPLKVLYILFVFNIALPYFLLSIILLRSFYFLRISLRSVKNYIYCVSEYLFISRKDPVATFTCTHCKLNSCYKESKKKISKKPEYLTFNNLSVPRRYVFEIICSLTDDAKKENVLIIIFYPIVSVFEFVV